jgi:hypothetical protein
MNQCKHGLLEISCAICTPREARGPVGAVKVKKTIDRRQRLALIRRIGEERERRRRDAVINA